MLPTCLVSAVVRDEGIITDDRESRTYGCLRGISALIYERVVKLLRYSHLEGLSLTSSLNARQRTDDGSL